MISSPSKRWVPRAKIISGAGTRTLGSCVKGKHVNHLHHTGDMIGLWCHVVIAIQIVVTVLLFSPTSSSIQGIIDRLIYSTLLQSTYFKSAFQIPASSLKSRIDIFHKRRFLLCWRLHCSCFNNIHSKQKLLPWSGRRGSASIFCSWSKPSNFLKCNHDKQLQNGWFSWGIW